MTIERFAGYSTFWTRRGQGDRQALMVHCSLAHNGAWRGVQKALEDLFDMLAFDLPGHGRSAEWHAPLGDHQDYQDSCVYVAEALLRKYTSGPVDLMGHSFGGTIALRLAQRAPDKVRSLTLFEPVLFAAAKNHPSYAENHAYMHGPFADAMRAGDRMEAARLFNVMWGRDADWHALPMALREDMASRIHLIPAGRAVTHEDLHGQLAPGVLEAVTAPVLLMEGESSPPLVSAVHDVLERRLPNVMRKVIKGAGHMAPITHAGDVAAAIRRFVLRG